MNIGGQIVTISQSAHTPPIATAGSSRSTTVGTPVTFNGSATAADGAAVTNYSWSFGDSTSASGTNVTHTYTSAGTNTVTLTVTDSFGATASATTTVAITNVPPRLSVALTNPVNGSTVSGTVNFSVNASANVAKVVYYCDGNSVVTNTTAPFTAAWNTKTTGNGSHNLYAKAFDASTNSAVSATNSAIVNNVTVMPTTASFGAAGGTSNVTITAASNYSWSATSGAAWITITSGATGSGNGTVSYTAVANSSSSNRTAILTVAGQTVTVSQSAHSAPVVSAGLSQTAAVGATVTFNGTATASDGATITNYSWSFGDSTSASGANVTHTYTSAGTNTVTLTVTDSFGANASATTTATISAATGTLSVSLTTPNNGSAVSNSVTLAASATNAAKVIFYCDGASIGTNTSSPFTSPWNTKAVGNGSHKLYAQAFDSNNNSTMSASNAVTVTNVITPGDLQWVKTMAAPNGYNAQGNSIAADAAGNIIVSGDFAYGVDLGNGNPFSLNGGYPGMFIVKYSPSGAVLWYKAFASGSTSASAKSVAVDSQSNILVAGSFAGTVDFGGTSLTAANPLSMFVAKYSPSGSLLWAKGFGGTAMASDFGPAVAVDGTNNIVLLGRLQSANVNFGGITITPPGSSSLVLVKISSSGATLWAKAYGTGKVVPQGLAIDRSGDIGVTGQFGTASDFGGGSISSVNAGNFSTFVAKYSGMDGSYRWAKAFGGSNDDSGYGIAADPTTGNFVVTGGFMGTADFGGGAITVTSDAVFLAGYDTSGKFLWAQTYGGASGTSLGNGVRIDGNGNLALTGVKGGGWNIGGTWNFNNGFFVQSYVLTGNAAPVQSWGKYPTSNTGGSGGNGVAFDTFGHVVTTGAFSYGTVDFGGISASTTPNSQYGYVTEYAR
jgi:hypothetical protein